MIGRQRSRRAIALSFGLIFGVWRLPAAAAPPAVRPNAGLAAKIIAPPPKFQPAVKAGPPTGRQHKKKSHKGG